MPSAELVSRALYQSIIIITTKPYASSIRHASIFKQKQQQQQQQPEPYDAPSVLYRPFV